MIMCALRLALLHLLFLPDSSCQAIPARARQVWAWANGNEAAEAQIRQLYNGTWNAVIDGIQAWCGCSFSHRGIVLNQTAWNACAPLVRAARDTNTKFQLIISGSIPDDAPVEIFITDALALHHHLRNSNMDGFSIDDEQDCSPRATTADFIKWTDWQSRFALGLKPYNLKVTSAVQALFGISSDNHNRPCDRHPSDYIFNSQVVETMQAATLERWLVMDTYYFSTGRFMGALDWHCTYISHETLGIGIMNRSDLTLSDWVARFHAMDVCGVNWINVFMMPIADELLSFLQRWKSFCSSCGKQTMLGCYDMTLPCDGRHGIIPSEL